MDYRRVMGQGTGTVYEFKYSFLQPFVGLFSYQLDEKTLAIGPYEDDCHNTPTWTPMSFNTFNETSLEEAQGSNAVTSETWVNERHGESLTEETLLDVIEEAEKELEADIVVDADDTAPIVSENFLEEHTEIVIEEAPKSEEDPIV